MVRCSEVLKDGGCSKHEALAKHCPRSCNLCGKTITRESLNIVVDLVVEASTGKKEKERKIWNRDRRESEAYEQNDEWGSWTASGQERLAEVMTNLSIWRSFSLFCVCVCCLLTLIALQEDVGQEGRRERIDYIFFWPSAFSYTSVIRLCARQKENERKKRKNVETCGACANYIIVWVRCTESKILLWHRIHWTENFIHTDILQG